MSQKDEFNVRVLRSDAPSYDIEENIRAAEMNYAKVVTISNELSKRNYGVGVEGLEKSDLDMALDQATWCSIARSLMAISRALAPEVVEATQTGEHGPGGPDAQPEDDRLAPRSYEVAHATMDKAMELVEEFQRLGLRETGNFIEKYPHIHEKINALTYILFDKH